MRTKNLKLLKMEIWSLRFQRAVVQFMQNKGRNGKAINFGLEAFANML
jgi:ribosomal protein L29